jgi:hypothetical protein
MAEGLYLYEVGSAQLSRPDLTNTQTWDELGISMLTQPTKHTLSVMGLKITLKTQNYGL